MIDFKQDVGSHTRRAEAARIIYLPESSIADAEIRELATNQSNIPTAAFNLLEKKIDKPQPIMAFMKSVVGKALEFMDRPGLRTCAKVITQTWVNIRDRELSQNAKYTIGRESDVWFCKQGKLHTTHSKLRWGPSPKDALQTVIDDSFIFYTPEKGDVVVSIGAGTGNDVLAASLKVGDKGKVYAIEAHPATFRALNVCCNLNRLKNVTTYPCAVSNINGSERIQDGKSSLSNSILSKGGGITVPSFTLDELAGRMNIKNIDLLLMNVEGAERRIIEGMDSVIQNVRNVCISCHDFRADRGDGEEMRTKDLIIAYLESQGFFTFTRDSDLPWVRCNVYGKRVTS